MSQKRGGSSNHYDNNRHKKPRGNVSNNANLTPLGSTGHTRNGPSSRPHHGPSNRSNYGPPEPKKYHNRDNPALAEMGRLPEPSKCEPCKLAAHEMETGLIALLDKVAAEELKVDGDRNILVHAQELRRLLSDRAKNRFPSQTKQAVDKKRPAQDKLGSVPEYVEHKIEATKDLPPLPPISEPHLQEAVFTHPSHYGTITRGADLGDKLHYERLEFLGDAYIELMASRLIHNRLPHIDVPQQSHFREQLIKNETLGKFSSAYALPDRLKHGGHMTERKAWTKVTADVFEAYVAAIVLSDPKNGFEAAENWLTELWAPQLLDYKEEIIENAMARDDMERLVGIQGVKLKYQEEKAMAYVNGNQRYFFGVYLSGWGYEDEWLGSGEGRNKAQACVFAAMDAMQRNNTVFKTAVKKKEEFKKLRFEEGAKREEEKVRERSAAKEDAPTESAEPSGTAADGKPANETAAHKELRIDKAAHDGPTSEKASDQTAESKASDASPQTATQQSSMSWLEKEKKKKEKKEKKRKRASHDSSP